MEIKTNIKENIKPIYAIHKYQSLPLRFINIEHDVVPKHWQLITQECEYFDTIHVTRESCRKLEADTTMQSKSDLWLYNRKDKITASNAHKVLIRKKNFESLLDNFLSPKPENELPAATKDELIHGTVYEPIAREKYINILTYQLNRNVNVRETGCIIQPKLFCVVASPHGLVSDRSVDDENVFGVIEIKCPKSKRYANVKVTFARISIFGNHQK